MSGDIEKIVREFVEGRVDAVGFAPASRFEDAPAGHRPERLLKNARTVIVLGKAVPRGILSSPDYGAYFLHRSYHTVYPDLDQLALSLSVRIEGKGPLAVPVPSYAPMVFHGMEPWGLLSLKHAARNSGLGAFGRTGLVYHPRFGAMLRLAAVVTTAELPGGEMIDGSPCPEGCRACVKACPSGALTEAGFEKMKCLAHSVKHAIYPIALRSKEGLENIERVINTAGHHYWLACHECLRVCPLNRPVPDEKS